MIEWENTLWETGKPGVCFLGTPYGSNWKMSIRSQASERAKKIGLELEKDYDGIKVLTTLRDGFAEIREQAIEMESQGEIPALGHEKRRPA